MVESKHSSKTAPRRLPDYVPEPVAEDLQRDMGEHSNAPEELELFKRLAFHPDMEGLYRKLGQNITTPENWRFFYASLIVDALSSELFKDIKQSRQEFEKRKRQARRGLHDLIEGLDWIVNPSSGAGHGFSIDFRENLEARLYGVFAAALRGETQQPSRDINPAEFLATCQTVLAILENPSRQKDDFAEQNNGTINRPVFVRAIVKTLQGLAANIPSSTRLLTLEEIATLTRVVFNQTEPDREGRYMYTREHVKEALKGTGC